MIQIGDKKVTKMIVGGNVMVNRENVWLPCDVVHGTTNMPVVMHYDVASGKTNIVGGTFVSLNNGYWSGDLITLPSGFHFVEGVTLPIVLGSASNIYPPLAISASGRTVSTTLREQPSTSSFHLLFGELDWSRGINNWSTDKIAPD